MLTAPLLVVYVNAIVAGVSPGPEQAALGLAASRGWPRDSLELERSRYYGPLGFNRAGYVEFRVKSTGKRLRVRVIRPASFVGRRVGPVAEVP